MKFEDVYPEFGIDGAKQVKKHLQECPICMMIFTLYRKREDKQFSKRDIKQAIDKCIRPNCSAESFDLANDIEKELKL